MTTVTFDISNDLAQRIQPVREQLPQILERGLRSMSLANPSQFAGLSDVFEFLAGLPSPEEIIAFRPSPELQQHINNLLEKNRSEGLSPAEEAEWQQIEYVEHFVRMAKARAHKKLQQPA